VKVPLRIFALLSFATTVSILSPIVSLAAEDEDELIKGDQFPAGFGIDNSGAER
jgi:hypothetical protein